MARTIQEIQNEIITRFQTEPELSDINSGSAFSFWRLITRIVAVSIATLENLFDAHKAEVQSIVSNLRPRTLKWYQQAALNFQYGADLPEGEVYYDNTGVDVDVVESQKIVAQAAATPNVSSGILIKVATQLGTDLVPLSAAEFTSFEAYVNEIKDAGVDVELRNVNADKLKLTVDVYYDPLVINSQGQRIDGTNNTPVQTDIKNYLRELDFTGTFVKAHLVDSLQSVEGVYVPEVRLCQAARNDSANFVTVDIQYQPFAGYLRFEDENTDLVINFINQEDI